MRKTFILKLSPKEELLLEQVVALELQTAEGEIHGRFKAIERKLLKSKLTNKSLKDLIN